MRLLEFFENQNLWWLVIIICLVSSRCSSTPQIDTVKYSSEIQQAKNDIDTSIDCQAQLNPKKCKKTVKRIKENLDRGLELAEKKDNENLSIKETNKELSVKADKWDTLIFYFWCIIGIILLIVVGRFAWKYRSIILKLAGVPIS